jgi:hypothetical protein
MLSTIPWGSLCWPAVILVLTTGLITFIRRFGKYENKAEAIGSDLNLVAFGFGVDLLVKAMKSEGILPKFPWPKFTLVPVVILFIGNLALYMLNLSIGEKIKDKTEKIKKGVATGGVGGLKGISIFFGIISAISFIVVGGAWS